MTRHPDRINDVLDELEEYWRQHPQLRLGQIIENMAARRGYEDAFYMEDWELKEEVQNENND
jgi:uncharacterized protein YihD (DUF1040 family)